MISGKRTFGIIIFLSVVLGGILPVSSSHAASSIEKAVRELDAKGARLEGADAIKYADEYLKLVNDDAINAADRVYALQGCMAYLRRVWRAGGYPKEVPPKADEVFSHYHADLIGALPDAEFDLVQTYLSSFLEEALANNRKQISECLAFIDTHEKTLDVNPQDPHANLCRASLFKIVNDKELTADFVDKYISRSTDPDGYAYTLLSWASEGLNRPDLALTAAIASVKRYGSAPDVAERNAKVLIGLLNSGDVDEAKVLENLPVFAHDGKGMAVILSALADRKLQAGDMDAVLAYAKLYYAVAPIEDFSATMETVARYIAMATLDPAQGMCFLEYQKYGANGPDGKVGTDDDCSDPLKDIGSPLSEDTRVAIEARLERLMPRMDGTYSPLGSALPRADSFYGILRDRGCIYLTLGRPKEALSLFRRAWDAAPTQWIEDANGLVPRALKALDGTVVRANAYAVYKQFGQAGSDGIVGSSDDLRDPLTQDIAPLSHEVQKALGEIAQNNTRSAGAYQLGGFAHLALGEYEKAFDKLRAAYVMVEPGPDQATIVENIAAAIKAFDGNVRRANQYLLFQKYGKAGPDGQVGTEDDLDNPLPTILRDIKKS